MKIKEKYLTFLVAVSFLIVGFYYSYAIFVTKQLQENVVAIKTINNEVSINYNGKDVIAVDGNSNNNYTLNIRNNGNVDVFYEVFFEGEDNIQVTLTSGEKKGKIKINEAKEFTINIHNFNEEDKTIELFVVTSNNENLTKKIGYRYINSDINFDHSNANKPNLDEFNLIPVTYYMKNNENGYWQKADASNKNELWYSYDDGIWANAVKVNSNSYEKYLAAPVGTNIEIGDIEGFYVWIPRFKYTVLNSNSYTNYERLYNVIFENGTQSSGTISCQDRIKTMEDDHLYSEICEDTFYGKIYDNLSTYTHSSFLDKDGIWVSKFLMSEGNGILKSLFSVPYIKENIDNAIKKSEDILPGKSHLLTNMEYSSIAILTNSQYGKSNNQNYIKENNYAFKRVYANSYRMEYTGCSSDYDEYSRNYLLNETDKCIEYNNLNDYSHITNGISYPVSFVGTGASTTGTIYGIYDMVNKNGEMVAAFAANSAGTISYNPLYYDVYSYNSYVGKITSSSNINNLFRYKLGDGIRENFRSFSINGMWQGGTLEQKENSVFLLRGGNGDIKDASIYTGVFVDEKVEAPFRVCMK